MTSERDTPPETVAAMHQARPPGPGPVRTSALRVICRSLRTALAAAAPLPERANKAPAKVVSTALPGVCAITAQWIWVTRARQPGTYQVLYKASRPDGRYLVHRVGANQFASELSHKLRQHARSTPTPAQP